VTARYLVTGAQGFIGRYLTAWLLTRPDAEVLGIGRSPEAPDRFSYTIGWAGRRRPAPLPPGLDLRSPRYRYAPVDITDRPAMTQALRSFRPDLVIHLAAGLRGEPEPRLVRTNVDGTRALLDAVAETVPRARKLLVGSSGAVYGAADTRGVAFDEDAECHPPDAYAATKLAAEDAARAWSARRGIPIVCARLFNALGPGEDDRHVAPEFARQAAEIAHGLREPTMEVGDLESTRDFIDVRDVARAMGALVTDDRAVGTFNIASGCETSIGSLLALVLDAAGLAGTVAIRPRAAAPAGVRRHVADVRRLAATGFERRVSLAESARDVVTYYMRTVAGAAGTLPGDHGGAR
jgi:GDP-4-dehydro-6-deoxy-D-mannose reductase